jgi:TolB-like protein/DNA-binding winged helix-turn-helix (wHTH) protein
MAVVPMLPNIARFGVFEADFRACELRRNGIKVRLQDLPFRALALLLSRPGELITHEEFRQALWPEDVFVDFERALRSAIKRLRDALGDNSGNPVFIETVERRGYRWIAPTHQPSIESAPVPATQFPESESERRVTTIVPASSRRVPRYWLAVALLAMSAPAVLFSLHMRQQTPISSVAILPFDNLSTPAYDDAFSDGLTDEVASSISHLEGVRVTGRRSAYLYKGKHADLREIGARLNVEAVVEGSVQHSGDRTHVTVQLNRTRDGFTIWSQTYDGTTADWFQIESQIATSIAHNLARQVNAQVATIAAPVPEAHSLYLEARYLWNQRNRAGLLRSVELLQQAIARDPNYADAWAGLADSLIAIGDVEEVDPAAYLPRAREAALKALQLNPNMAQAHAALGMIACHYDYDWPTAEREYKKAFELNPSYASAHQYYALGLMAHGRFTEAQEQLDLARHLDPLALVVDVDAALLNKYLHDYNVVIAISKSVIERDPNSNYGYAMLTTGYYCEKRWDDWRAADEKFPQDAFTRALANGRRDEELRELRKLIAGAQAGATRPSTVVRAANRIGNRDLALYWLEKSFAHHDYWELFINVDPEFDWLHSEPRFQALVHKLGVD